jgi:hypothetical protein
VSPFLLVSPPGIVSISRCFSFHHSFTVKASFLNKPIVFCRSISCLLLLPLVRLLILFVLIIADPPVYSVCFSGSLTQLLTPSIADDPDPEDPPVPPEVGVFRIILQSFPSLSLFFCVKRRILGTNRS